MNGRTPAAAHRRFTAAMQSALSCVTRGVLLTDGADPADLHSAFLPGAGGLPLSGVPGLELHILLGYRFRERDVPAASRWQIEVVTYHLAIETAERQELLAFHLHPHIPRAPGPHIHLGAAARVGHLPLRKAHIPGRHMAVSDLVRFAILEFGARTLRADWQHLLPQHPQPPA